jgi:hypothetical protein
MTTQSRQSIIPDSHKDIVATLGPSGEPQCNPVWFDWDGEARTCTGTTGPATSG